MEKTAAGLVKFVQQYIKSPYWYGTFVIPCTDGLLNSKAIQFRTHYTQSRWDRYKDDIINKRTCSDCVGLIKGYGWQDEDGNVKYATNGVPDVSANGMFAAAREKGTLNSMPEIPGLAVRFDGHIGVYIGNGEVVEAKGFAYGIVKTKLSAGKWTHWLKIPWITYEPTIGDSIGFGPLPFDPMPKPYPLGFGQRILKPGMKGEDVRYLQTVLIYLKYSCGKYGADADFGDGTYLAVSKYQRVKGLLIDGEVGSLTRKTLENDYQSIADSKKNTSTSTPEPTSELTPEPKPVEFPLGFGKEILKKGMTGPEVKCLQNALINLGFECGPDGADGAFGNATYAAVVSYQKSKELEPPNGEVGAETRLALEKDLPDCDKPIGPGVDTRPMGKGFIVDVSQHNKLTDTLNKWDEIASNVGLMILRCGVTRTVTKPLGIGIDDHFAFAAAKCQEYRIPFGVYYYGKVATVPEACKEADICWDTAEPFKPKFYVYDVEENCLTDDVITAWFDQMRKRGAKKLGIYIGGDFYVKHRLIVSKFDFVWYPRYGKNTGAFDPKYTPPHPCDLHQYTSAGSVAGFRADALDISVICGKKSYEWFAGS